MKKFITLFSITFLFMGSAYANSLFAKKCDIFLGKTIISGKEVRFGITNNLKKVLKKKGYRVRDFSPLWGIHHPYNDIGAKSLMVIPLSSRSVYRAPKGNCHYSVEISKRVSKRVLGQPYDYLNSWKDTFTMETRKDKTFCKQIERDLMNKIPRCK